MEVFWITPAGGVKGAYFYEDDPTHQWLSFDMAPAGSAAGGAIKAVSRRPDHMEVWWISPAGAVKGAFYYDNQAPDKRWVKYEVAPPGSAVPGAIAAVSPSPTNMQVMWTTASGAVEMSQYDEALQLVWPSAHKVAPPNSAIPGGSLEAIHNNPFVNLWWISSTADITWAIYNVDAVPARLPVWHLQTFAAADNAAKEGGLAATNAGRGRIALWWITVNGSVQQRIVQYDHKIG